MNKSEAKRLLNQCCEKYGIKSDEVIQFGYATSQAQKRFVYKTSHLTRLSTHRYALKYFSYENLYIAWNLLEGKKAQDVFSVMKTKINVMPSEIELIICNVEHSGGDTRTIYVFIPENLESFIRQYVARVDSPQTFI